MDIIIKMDTQNRKCIRCGKCCLASPCFFIGFKKEVYDSNGQHVCPHLYFKDNIAICKIYKNNESLRKTLTGYCSNSKF